MLSGMLRRGGREEAARNAAAIKLAPSREGEVVCLLTGSWTTHSVGQLDREVQELSAKRGVTRFVADLSGVQHLDTAGAWVIARLTADLERRGVEVEVIGQSEAARILLAAVAPSAEETDLPRRNQGGPWLLGGLATIGRVVYGIGDDLMSGANILGATISGPQMKLGRKHTVNPAAITNQIDRMGVGAVPIIVLMSAIVGAIIAQQGAFQLRYFGAEIFVVDLVGILIMRELGVLLTAIMIAGRSGSAITAEIGSMKMREEVDALRVIGLNPIGVLVFPRLVALVIAVPCLTIIANFAALAGAMAVALVYSDISPTAFVDRLRSAIDLTSIFAGLIKAPFMALIIGIIASVEGMKVGGSAESLGSHVTASVVKSIFIVIVIDGLFAMFYASIDF